MSDCHFYCSRGDTFLHLWNFYVHCILIDLTKAFDHMNFNVLRSKLHKIQVPPLNINLLGFMVKNSFISVYFNSEIGDEWKIGTCSQHGGISLPNPFY